MAYRLGVDTGGTFTDLALANDTTGELVLHKLPSTPRDPSEAIVRGLMELLELRGLGPDSVAYLGHGTTVGTNAIIERKTARTALITTQGFRDVIELARQRRPDLYDLDVDKPRPLVPRNLRFEVRERTAYDGSIVTPLDEGQVRSIVGRLRELDVSAVAVCFLHSFVNPAHERRVKEIFGDFHPRCFVSLSSEVLPEFREYERFSTTMTNAALVPVMAGYLRRLEKGAAETGLRAGLRIMQSSGGVMGSVAATERPINTLFSGPSAGVIGASHVAAQAGFPDIITFDMGGTSTDVCLVEDGKPLVTTQRVVDGFPVKCPTLDVHSIGAGGGSVGWVDSGGFLKVGPGSAGAWPGPACYSQGGTEPTVTDANIVLGRLNETHLLGGRMRIDSSLSVKALTRLGERLGMGPVAAARGVIRIVNSNIIGAIRVISVEKGYDPRRFTLMAFGGAGPLHAAQLARDLGIPQLLVPESPGVLCALGLLLADLRADFGHTFLTPAANPDLAGVNQLLAELEEQARVWLRREDASAERSFIERSADMRYIGQDYELPVPVLAGTIDESTVGALVSRFHEAHELVHGYASPDAAVEFVALRVVARSLVSKPTFAAGRVSASDPSSALVGSRRVYFDETSEFVDTPLYDRLRLVQGSRVDGPAVIEQMDSTTVVLPGQSATVDQYRNIVIREN